MGSIARAFDGRKLILITRIIVADQGRVVQLPIRCAVHPIRESIGKATSHWINVAHIAGFGK